MQNPVKILLAWFGFLIFLISCHKESGPTHVDGTVQDKTTNTGVADADVALFETDGESAWGLGGTMIDETWSDANGNFTFDFNAREGYQYYVQAIKDQYWNDQSNNVEFVNELGSSQNLTVYLQPEGYLKLHFYDTIPYLTNYELRAWPFEDFLEINAYALDTTIYGTVYGNTYFNLYWVFEEMSTGLIYSDSDVIYCPAFDTTYYDINY